VRGRTGIGFHLLKNQDRASIAEIGAAFHAAAYPCPLAGVD
jgi:hypothetical protein